MWAKISELMAPNMHHSPFLIHHFVHILTHIIKKLQVVCRHSTYWTIALLLEMSIFWVTAGCGIRLMNYNSKHASQSLSNVLFVHTYNLKAIQVIYGNSKYQMTTLLLETFLWGLELYERFNWRVTVLDTHQSFSDTILYLYTAILYIHCYLMHKYVWQQNSHTVAYDCSGAVQWVRCQAARMKTQKRLVH